jgi:hypothetical protein
MSFTRVPNSIIDEIKLNPYQFQLFTIIVRKTDGWCKVEDGISLSQFEKLVTFKRPKIISTLKELAELGLIEKKQDYNKDKKQFSYSMYRVSQGVVTENNKGSNSGLQGVVTEDYIQKKIDTKETNTNYKEKNKQKRKEEPNAKRIEEQNTNDKNNIAILSNPSEPTSHENKKKVSTQGRKVKIDSRAICEPLNQYQLLNEIEKALFQEYFEMRELVKVKTTVGIAERLLKTYFKFGRNPKIIENAINANWRDFYPLKNVEQQKTQEEKQQEAIERVLERKRQGGGSLFGEIGL